MRITIKLDAPKFAAKLAGLRDRFDKAITASMNMAASMMREAVIVDIASAGKFGQRWFDAVKIDVLTNMKISMSINLPGADIFATGGTITGHPLMWLPISGTDAEGIQAKDFHDPMFSGKSRSGTPLLFSLTDKLPKYFGTESVTIPKLFHLQDDVNSVMKTFRSVFDNAWAAS